MKRASIHFAPRLKNFLLICFFHVICQFHGLNARRLLILQHFSSCKEGCWEIWLSSVTVSFSSQWTMVGGKVAVLKCTIHTSAMEELKIEQGISEGFDSCDRPSYLKLDSNRRFFSQCDLEIWWMISENNRALLLYYIKLCALFQIHRWIQTGVAVRKRSIRVEVGDILSCGTLKFDRQPWKTIGHLF